MNLTLIDAFRRFGARPSHRLGALSAMAEDGSMVLNCSSLNFVHPTRGVLRYEDRLSRESSDSKNVGLLAQHLTLALGDALPVRMIVASLANAKDGAARGYHVRPDLVGKVLEFDGDHFIVDFRRQEVA
jgi:hypothetical protein